MKNTKLLKSYRGRDCELCGDPSSTAAHIQSRGAHGSDTEDNLLGLCFRCHRTQHDRGWGFLVKRSPELKEILEAKGFHIVEEFGRWRLKRI